jgi:hypothetical protein
MFIDPSALRMSRTVFAGGVHGQPGAIDGSTE